MTTAVTLDVFSGRSNPTWQLDQRQEKELEARIASLKTMFHGRPTGVVGGLGYRGFTKSRHDTTFSATGQMRIHEAIVDRGTAGANFVDETEIERFLLSTLPGRLPTEVQSHVTAQVSAMSRFGVNARQISCPPCLAADAPTYNPSAWNNPAVQPHNNCYNYANDHATNTFAHPGRAHGVSPSSMDCGVVQHGATADGLVVAPNFATPLQMGGGWYVALVIWPGADYHWYRQDRVGCWSHKPGPTAVRDVDNAGLPISDPKLCNRGPYTVFCNYMVTKRSLTIT